MSYVIKKGGLGLMFAPSTPSSLVLRPSTVRTTTTVTGSTRGSTLTPPPASAAPPAEVVVETNTPAVTPSGQIVPGNDAVVEQTPIKEVDTRPVDSPSATDLPPSLTTQPEEGVTFLPTLPQFPAVKKETCWWCWMLAAYVGYRIVRKKKG